MSFAAILPKSGMEIVPSGAMDCLVLRLVWLMILISSSSPGTKRYSWAFSEAVRIRRIRARRGRRRCFMFFVPFGMASGRVATRPYAYGAVRLWG